MLVDAVNLLYTDACGIYIPQLFVKNCLETTTGSWHNLSTWAVGECLAGPETDGYWEAWDDICGRAKFVMPDGREFNLYQDGDLWLICYAQMSDEEKSNFGFED
jgi:hypothetical protein